jgi:DNA-binding response OmpR family regulator
MKRKIVLIDDDQGIREVISIILEENNFDVVTIDQDKNIERILAKEKPELILLDIWIAGKDGRNILKRLKSNPDFAAIPVIMISAKNDGSVLAKEAGAEDFVTKPFEIDDLLTKIQHFLPSSKN